MIAKSCYQIWKWARRGVQQLYAIYCMSLHAPFSDIFIDLFSPFLQNVSPLLAELYFDLYWDTIWCFCSLSWLFLKILFCTTFPNFSSLESVYKVLFSYLSVLYFLHPDHASFFYHSYLTYSPMSFKCHWRPQCPSHSITAVLAQSKAT